MQVPNALYRDLAGIGVELSSVRANRNADIERTLLEASKFVDSDDRRILGYLASWVTVHANLVCIGKLRRLMEEASTEVRQTISALASMAVTARHHEWKSLVVHYPDRILWDSDATRAALKLKGPEEALAASRLLLPKGFLRIRAADILPVQDLAKVHLQTRLRLIFGANLRADAVFYLSRGVISASDLMRKIGCS